MGRAEEIFEPFVTSKPPGEGRGAGPVYLEGDGEISRLGTVAGRCAVGGRRQIIDVCIENGRAPVSVAELKRICAERGITRVAMIDDVFDVPLVGGVDRDRYAEFSDRVASDEGLRAAIRKVCGEGFSKLPSFEDLGEGLLTPLWKCVWEGYVGGQGSAGGAQGHCSVDVRRSPERCTEHVGGGGAALGIVSGRFGQACCGVRHRLRC